jgi:hypothetical protein
VDKWDGLAPYWYSIAVENSKHANYFTEKLSDCFLAYTLPFYYGCPNIKDYFDDRSFVWIDINDFEGSQRTIESAIRVGAWDKSSLFVKESRRLVLEKYHFIAALTDILQDWPNGKGKSVRTLRPQQYFTQDPLKEFVRKSWRKITG